MSLLKLSSLALVVLFSPIAAVNAAEDPSAAPIKVLLIAGGCCHDYPKQSKILKAGIEERINAEVTIVLTLDKTTKAKFELYEAEDWAKGFDVVLHDECSANVTDKEYVDGILAVHKAGMPAVNLHCVMHCYRWGDYKQPVKVGDDNAGWFEMLGLQSSGHGPKAPIDLVYGDAHPATAGLTNWTTGIDELYNNVQLFPSADVLAMGRQLQPPTKKALKQNPDAEGREESAVVVWTNTYGPNDAKIFSTTLGHYDAVVADENYLDLVSRGLLWTTGKLADDGTVAAGYEK